MPCSTLEELGLLVPQYLLFDSLYLRHPLASIRKCIGNELDRADTKHGRQNRELFVSNQFCPALDTGNDIARHLPASPLTSRCKLRLCQAACHP